MDRPSPTGYQIFFTLVTHGPFCFTGSTYPITTRALDYGFTAGGSSPLDSGIMLAGRATCSSAAANEHSHHVSHKHSVVQRCAETRNHSHTTIKSVTIPQKPKVRRAQRVTYGP